MKVTKDPYHMKTYTKTLPTLMTNPTKFLFKTLVGLVKYSPKEIIMILVNYMVLDGQFVKIKQ